MRDDDLEVRDEVKAAVLSDLAKAPPGRAGQRGKMVHLVGPRRVSDDVDELRTFPTLAFTPLVESVRWTCHATIPLVRSVVEELVEANEVVVTQGGRLANPNPPRRRSKPASPPADAGTWTVSPEVAAFLEHVRRPNPSFRCVAAGDEEGPTFTVKVKNQFRPPADAAALGLLRETLGVDADSFLARITPDPARFLEDAGCHTRYADGKSNAQWIPKSFEPGSR